MKMRCYSNYTYYLPLGLCFALLAFAFMPFLFFKNDSITWKIVWSVSMTLFSAIMFFSFLFHKQVIILSSEKIVLKNTFGIMQQLNPKNCLIEINRLPTEYSWATGTTRKKWICIYEKSNEVVRFKSGVANGRKHQRIQAIFNDRNVSILKKYGMLIENETPCE